MPTLTVNEEEGKQFALNTFDLPNQEIFAAGTWNGDRYETSDLDAMVQAYQENEANYKPKLKLTHDHPKGWPSVGWMENLRRAGDKLVADFKGIPKKIFDLIQSGGYSGKSAEILWNPVINGKKVPYFMKALALLGVDMKGCENIGDMMSSLYASDGGEAKAYKSEPPQGESKTYNLGYEEENKQMEKIEQLTKDLAESEVRLADSEAKVAKYEAETSTLRLQVSESKAESERANEKLKEFAAKEIETRVVATVDKLITDKKLAPAKKESAYALLRAVIESGSEKKYKLGEKQASLEDIAIDLLGAEQVNFSTETQSHAGKRQDDGKSSAEEMNKDGEINTELADKATEYAKQNKVSYRDALRHVAREDGIDPSLRK